MRWYEACRRDLPWRNTRDPWAIWVSEIMLQQTRVETVIPFFRRFMTRFPAPLALAEAPLDEVLSAWSGLGYYRRARLLQAGAQAALRGIPDSREGLLELPGIGRYTAGAIASIAFGEAVGLVDGNVARVLSRLFTIDLDMKGRGMRRAEAIADAIVHRGDPGSWNQALMELGATVCTPRTPACDRCPVSGSCGAYREGRVAELPVLAAKAKPKLVRMQALVARKDDAVLLARRRKDGLFGGLWEPPAIEGSAKAREDLLRRFPVAVSSVRRSGKVTHVLSHRRLHVDVHAGVIEGSLEQVELPEAYETASLFDAKARGQIGLAAFAKKVLHAAGSQ
jgi:A/G-specific adenine glycosylase